MQPYGRTELFWPRQLVRKWLQFKPTGDDFRADHHHFEHDPPAAEDEDDEALYRRNTRESLDVYPEIPFVVPERADLRRSGRPLIRGQSETLRKQYVDTKEYRIAVGTWNVAGRPPPEELDLEDWLDSNQEADIYVLGFQEIVPLNAGNVLCVEDEGPAAKWDNLIREALNNKAASSQSRSRSAPQSPWKDPGGSEAPEFDIDRIIEGVASEDKICSLMESQFSEPENARSKGLQEQGSKERLKKAYKLTPDERLVPGRRASIEGRVVSDGGRLSAYPEVEFPFERNIQRRSIDERSILNPALIKHARHDSSLYDWSLKEVTPGPAEGFHSFLEQEESLQTPLFAPSGEGQTFTRDSSQSRSLFSRVASKQMVGLFITVWVRTELRRHVHNVKVSCVGCGLMGYLGNKGSISVSMSLHQTSFCFTCSHLTSGHKEGDEYRRNSDVAEILRRTTFPRTSKLLQLPETIMSHDCMIWLGDLNYRLTLPDHEARSMVAREDWGALLEKDQLRIEQNAGHVFDGWQEGPIYFPPTYKYVINSDRYSGESYKPGEKRRTPAWCDRILWLGKALREIRYIRTESRLSDHRPVSAVFIAEVERVSRHKLKRAVSFASPIPNMNAEDISPHLSSLQGFHRVPFTEMKYPPFSDENNATPVNFGTAKLTVSQSFKHNLRKESSLPAGCMMKIGEDMEQIPNQGLGSVNLLSVF